MDFGSMVAGGIIGLAVAIAKDYFGDKRKQKEKEKQFRREKLEEVFTLLDKECKVVSYNFSDRLTYSYEKAILERSTSRDISVKLTMCIYFYFDNMVSVYDTYQNVLSSLQEKLLSPDKIEKEDINKYLNCYKAINNLILLEIKKL